MSPEPTPPPKKPVNTLAAVGGMLGLTFCFLQNPASIFFFWGFIPIALILMELVLRLSKLSRYECVNVALVIGMIWGIIAALGQWGASSLAGLIGFTSGSLGWFIVGKKIDTNSKFTPPPSQE